MKRRSQRNFTDFWGIAGWNWDTIRLVGVAMVGALFSSDAWNNVTFTAGEVRNPKRNLPLSLALGRGRCLGALPGLQPRLSERAAARSRSRPRRRIASRPRSRSRCSDRVGVQLARRRDHDLDLRLRERHAPRRRARLLRDGAGSACSSGRRANSTPSHTRPVDFAVAAMRLGLPADV